MLHFDFKRALSKSSLAHFFKHLQSLLFWSNAAIIPFMFFNSFETAEEDKSECLQVSKFFMPSFKSYKILTLSSTDKFLLFDKIWRVYSMNADQRMICTHSPPQSHCGVSSHVHATRWKRFRAHYELLVDVWMLQEFFQERISWAEEEEVIRNFMNLKNIARYKRGLLIKNNLCSIDLTLY